MNFNGKDIPALKREWRKRYGVDAPLGLRPHRVTVTRHYIVPAVDRKSAVQIGLEGHPELEQGEPQVKARRV